MKRINQIIFIVLLIGACVSCNRSSKVAEISQSNDNKEVLFNRKMTMTTAKSGIVKIIMAGTGTFTIGWGDGTAIETYTFLEYMSSVINTLISYFHKSLFCNRKFQYTYR